jgi:hypothetical protein
MSRNLSASDRASLVRLASSLPAGSAQRKAILAGLGKTDRTSKTASTSPVLTNYLTELIETASRKFGAEILAKPLLYGQGGKVVLSFSLKTAFSDEHPDNFESKPGEHTTEEERAIAERYGIRLSIAKAFGVNVSKVSEDSEYGAGYIYTVQLN